MNILYKYIVIILFANSCNLHAMKRALWRTSIQNNHNLAFQKNLNTPLLFLPQNQKILQKCIIQLGSQSAFSTSSCNLEQAKTYKSISHSLCETFGNRFINILIPGTAHKNIQQDSQEVPQSVIHSIEEIFASQRSPHNQRMELDFSLENRLTNNATLRKQYIQWAAENFSELCNRPESKGIWFLTKLVNLDKKNALKAFTQPAMNHFGTEKINYEIAGMICQIIDQESSFLDYFRDNKSPIIDQLIKKVETHFPELFIEWDGIKIIEKLMQKNSYAQDRFILCLTNNIPKIFKATYEQNFSYHDHLSKSVILSFKNSRNTSLLQKSIKGQIPEILSALLDSRSNSNTGGFFMFLMDLNEEYYELFAQRLFDDVLTKKRTLENIPYDFPLGTFLKNETIKEKFLSYCSENLDVVISNSSITSFLRNEIGENPSLTYKISMILVQDITKLIKLSENKIPENIHSLIRQCRWNRDTKKMFDHALFSTFNTFESIFSDDTITTFFINMTYSNPELTGHIKTIMNNNLDKLSECSDDISYFCNQLADLNYRKLRNDNDYKDNESNFKLAQEIIDDYPLLELTNKGPELIYHCLKKHPELKNNFLKSIEDKIEKVSPLTLALAINHSSENIALQKWLTDHQRNSTITIDTLLKIQAYNDFSSKTYNFSKISDSPTLLHIQKKFSNYRLIDKQSYIGNDITIGQDPHFAPYLEFRKWEKYFSLKNPHMKIMVQQISNKERTLNNDYYTFIHGQRSSYLPYEQLHTFISSVINNQNTNQEHLLLHIKKPLTSSTDILQEENTRKTLINQGRYNIKDKELRQHLLFTNWAYFANSTNTGSSSARYIALNDNVGSIYTTYSQIFHLNNLSHLYNKYNEQLEELHTTFTTITQHGTCILIAIPKSTIKEQAYLAASGGFKTTLSIEGIGQTDDMSLIMETLTKSPEKIDNIDKIEFCIPMTYDTMGALNPESGIKVFAFNAADQEKLDNYYARQRELFAQIKQDIEAQNN